MFKSKYFATIKLMFIALIFSFTITFAKVNLDKKHFSAIIKITPTIYQIYPKSSLQSFKYIPDNEKLLNEIIEICYSRYYYDLYLWLNNNLNKNLYSNIDINNDLSSGSININLVVDEPSKRNSVINKIKKIDNLNESIQDFVKDRIVSKKRQLILLSETNNKISNEDYLTKNNFLKEIYNLEKELNLLNNILENINQSTSSKLNFDIQLKDIFMKFSEIFTIALTSFASIFIFLYICINIRQVAKIFKF